MGCIVSFEAWDRAGNFAMASKKVEMDKSLPQINLALTRGEEKTVVNLRHGNTVPLKYWRLEMWTKEGKILTQSEGKELPVKIGIELPDVGNNQEIQGFLFYSDVMGKQVRQKVEDLLPKLEKDTEAREEKPAGISESWVDEF